MKRDRIGENIAYKVYMAALSIERAATVGPVDRETALEIREDAEMLSRDPVFRKAYAEKHGAGALWLDKLISDARAPYPADEPIVERELWRWCREARDRAQA